MVNGSNNHINVGDNLTRNDYLGRMGNTGNSTGTHLHLECSTTQNWSCSTFLTPGDALGWGNTRGDILEYTDEPTPPHPTATIKRKKFPWVLYARKLRNN